MDDTEQYRIEQKVNFEHPERNGEKFKVFLFSDERKIPGFGKEVRVMGADIVFDNVDA
jgi:hypothetical protein